MATVKSTHEETSNPKEAIRKEAAYVAKEAGDIKESISKAKDAVYDAAAQMAHEAKEKFSDKLGVAKESINDTLEDAKHKLNEAESIIENYVRNNPLKSIGWALLAGVAISQLLRLKK